jgi:hypothetical protein
VNTINALITLLTSRGILVYIPGIPIPTITGITVDVSGFTVRWQAVTGATSYTLLMDGKYYSNITQTSYSFTGYPNTNIFPYIVSVAAVTSAGYSKYSPPFPVSIFNINNDAHDLNNYPGSFGIGPTSYFYFRATSPGTNYIILISEKRPVTNDTVFYMQGSNASTLQPIRFKTWDYGAYSTPDIKITDVAPHVFTYFSISVRWRQLS